ncbi:MAG: 8-amino-7-oxononanoate synthase, partial [Candidatus Omnitrophica bacterium]|nr:8-amino-7-oxononanoate synthase [Candidatus Omnitrophota bacterium]
METTNKFDWLQEALTLLKGKNLYRQFRVLDQLKGTQATIDGKQVVLFCGN